MAITVASSFDQTAGVPLDSRFVVADTTARDAIASGVRYEGLTVYVVADAKNYQLVGGISDGDWTELQGSGGGGINYILAPDGTNITGWTTYADAAAASPVDGNGGSPASTFAISTDSSLVGAENFLWTKSAANRQGEGFAYAFTIDQAYQSKPITISALYRVASGTYADSDMSVWVYDVTNTVLIQPTSYQIKNTTGVETIKCEFQAASNSTSYRLIFHTASTSSSAYTLRFDNFSVSPNTYNSGAFISEWTSSRSVTPNGFGTISGSNYWSRRVGDSLQMRGYFTMGTPSGTASISLPSGLVIDSAKFGSGTRVQKVGISHSLPPSSGAATSFATKVSHELFYDGSDTSAIYVANGIGNQVDRQYDKSVAANIAPSASGDAFNFDFTVPISGWGTSQVLSSDTDTRVVDFQAVKSAGSYTSPGALATWTVTNKDSHGAFDSSSGVYTVPVAGDYWFSGKVSTSVTTTLNLFKNGTIVFAGTNGSSSNGITANYLAVNCVAGDTFYLSMPDNGTITTNTAPYVTMFAGSRISGPSQIAASETVMAKYTAATQTITGSVAVVKYLTKSFDTHGAYSTSTGIFTVPVPGKYLVQVSHAPTANISGTANQQCVFEVYKNGSAVDTLARFWWGSTASFYATPIGSATVQCVAGDTLEPRAQQNTGNTYTSSGDYQCAITFTRIGN